MKRTDIGYETENYKVVRHIGVNIFSGKRSVDYWIIYDKKTNEKVITWVALKDAREYLRRKGEKV